MDKLKREVYDYTLPKEQPIPRYFGIKPDYDFMDFYIKNDEDKEVMPND